MSSLFDGNLTSMCTFNMDKMWYLIKREITHEHFRSCEFELVVTKMN